ALQIPVYTAKWPKESHPISGTEEAARKFRYTFFSEIMGSEHADFVVTAHHQGDQVETILMRLVRGSQLDSLTGIQPSRHFYSGKLIRPLLPLSKEDLYHYAERNTLPYMEDAYNISAEFTRNRYRQVILPLLREENPQLDHHLAQFAA